MRNEAERGMVHRMKDDWKMVRAAFKKEQDMTAAYADRRRADYQFKEWQDVLINMRRHYRGQFGSDRGPLAPRAVGPFRVTKANPMYARAGDTASSTRNSCASVSFK